VGGTGGTVNAQWAAGACPYAGLALVNLPGISGSLQPGTAGSTGSSVVTAIAVNLCVTGGAGGGGVTAGGSGFGGGNITGAGWIPTISGGALGSGGSVSNPGSSGIALSMPTSGGRVSTKYPSIFLGGAGGGPSFPSVSGTIAGAGGNGSYGCGGGGGGGCNGSGVSGIGGPGGRGGDGLVVITCLI